MQQIVLGTDDVSCTIRIVDSTAFTPEEAVTSASAGLALWYRKGALGAVTALTEGDLAGVDSAHSDGGMIHIDDGYYRVDLPDAAIPTIENEVTVVGGTVTGMIVLGTALIGVQAIGAPAGASVSADIATVQATVSGLGSGTGAALNFAASGDNTGGALKSISFVGSQANTYASTAAEDGTRHEITDSGGSPDIDIVYQFDVGNNRNAAGLTWKGYVTNADTVTVQAYNFSGTSWDTVATITGTASTANVTREIPLLARHTGTGTEAGDVYVRFTSTGQSSIVVRTDQLLVSGVSVSSSTGYADGAVWVKATGTSGTTPDVNGTADNPCPWADALVVATAKGLSRFRIINGETVTLTGALTSKSVIGKNWTLALGGQSIAGSYIEGATVTGSGTATTAATFVDCFIGSGTGAVSIGPSNFLRCGFNTPSGNAFSAASAGNWSLVDCYSQVAGSGTPVFTYSGAQYINIRRWSGGNNITLDSTSSQLSVEVVTGGGQTVAVGGADVEIRGICRAITLTGITSASTVQIAAVTGPISLAGADGTVNIYGVCGTVTDSRTGTPTLTNTADVSTDVNAILDDTGTSGVVVASVGTGAITAASIASAAAAKVADIVLRRTTANVEASSDGDTLSGRSLYGAVARLAHKVSISGATMTVTRSDDATALTTATMTTDETADPVTAVDPAA